MALLFISFAVSYCRIGLQIPSTSDGTQWGQLGLSTPCNITGWQPSVVSFGCSLYISLHIHTTTQSIDAANSIAWTVSDALCSLHCYTLYLRCKNLPRLQSVSPGMSHDSTESSLLPAVKLPCFVYFVFAAAVNCRRWRSLSWHIKERNRVNTTLRCG